MPQNIKLKAKLTMLLSVPLAPGFAKTRHNTKKAIITSSKITGRQRPLNQRSVVQFTFITASRSVTLEPAIFAIEHKNLLQAHWLR